MIERTCCSARLVKMGTSAEGENKYAGNTRARRSANDFMFGKLIGEGSFSVVYLAKDVHTSKEWAVKVCEKRQIIRERKQEYVKREREALNRLSGLPGFLNLFCTFQDSSKLYFVMTFAKNGTLLQLMERVKQLDMDCVRFYSAQILHAIEQMHANNIIHRDLKPENILLDDKFHIMIADFGSSRIDGTTNDNVSSDEKEESASESDEQSAPSQRKRRSFVGTAQYVSPEILKGKDSTKASDIWSFGCILYQMIAGFPPFQGPNDYLIFQKITKLELTFPNDFDHIAADLIVKLLVLNPQKRLGVKDKSPYDSIRNHKFLEGIDFLSIRKMSPPFLISALLSGECTKEDSTLDVYDFPDNIKPGLDNEQITRLLGQDWLKIGAPSTESNSSLVDKILKIPASDEEKSSWLEEQKSDMWHSFAEGELILKKGFVNKRKGALYVPRKRMLLLTTGPKLIYIDPVQMVKKGEIPWNEKLRAEAKNFKMFFVHTPHRTYYLEDSQGYALKWCQAIQEMHDKVYKN